ncbi:excisionase family DNA-binding protein [Desulfobacterales bacterium HSG16]|nr:excisionase family DNA-binding protein [Desulfobacterales bacterium HSG16]
MKPQKNESGWATIDDAAKYLSVHRETIMEWMKNGLEYYHLPQNQVRIKYTDIDKFMIRFKKIPKKRIDINSEVLDKQENLKKAVENVKRKLSSLPPEKIAPEIKQEKTTGVLAVVNQKTQKKYFVPKSSLVGKEHGKIRDQETGEILVFSTKTGDIILRYGKKRN